MMQKPLFITAGPLFPWESPAEALAGPPSGAPAGRRRRAAPKPQRQVRPDADDEAECQEPEKPIDPARERLRKLFETFLRDKGWPYVAVDEAKKAVLGASQIESFDFLVYSSANPNLLVLLQAAGAPVARADLDGMGEWEKVFGTDFRAVFVSPADAGWTCRMLPGPDGKTEERELADLV
jgi:hypothetical protein